MYSSSHQFFHTSWKLIDRRPGAARRFIVLKVTNSTHLRHFLSNNETFFLDDFLGAGNCVSGYRNFRNPKSGKPKVQLWPTKIRPEKIVRVRAKSCAKGCAPQLYENYRKRQPENVNVNQDTTDSSNFTTPRNSVHLLAILYNSSQFCRNSSQFCITLRNSV